MVASLLSKGLNRAWKEQIGFKEVNASGGGILRGENTPGRWRRRVYKNNKGINTRRGITVVNIYEHITGAPKYIKQILTDIKREIDNNTIIVGDFNTPVTSMGRPSRQKVNKATVVLNDTIEQLDLIDIYRTFHPKTRMHILFRCAWNILQPSHTFQIFWSSNNLPNVLVISIDQRNRNEE